MNEKRESYYMGRPLSELTKEELIEIVESQSKQLLRLAEDHAGDIRVLCGDKR